MKKLMIAAAAAALSIGAFADCRPGQAQPQYSATVYSVKISLKTPKGEACAHAGRDSACAPGVDQLGFVRTPSTYTMQGYFANCTVGCDKLAQFTSNDLALWNAKEKLFLQRATYNVDFLHVLSKSQKNAEIYFTLAGTMDSQAGSDSLKRTFKLTAAGFGKFSPSEEIYTSFSGNVVGSVDKVFYPKTYKVSAADIRYCPPAFYWNCATFGGGCGALSTALDANSVAYGTFAIKYNASASKKMAAGTRPSIPSYVATPTGW